MPAMAGLFINIFVEMGVDKLGETNDKQLFLTVLSPFCIFFAQTHVNLKNHFIHQAGSGYYANPPAG